MRLSTLWALMGMSLFGQAIDAAELPSTPEHVNSIGMRLVRISPGAYTRGENGGEAGRFDEAPAHRVRISRPFYIGIFEVTNAELEAVLPERASLRGKLGMSKEDTEAAVFVSWDEASEFCRLLAAREGLPYRLPTEAEWEYACRAGTTTSYSTGKELPKAFHKNVKESWYPDHERTSAEKEVVSLHVGKTPANTWGIYDMHGNVEEWCSDWYGPYSPHDQVDPVGPARGDFRVTRGGSHGTKLEYLRSANRSGTLPGDRTWQIGFRVVIGEPSDAEPGSAAPAPLWARDVSQQRSAWDDAPDPKTPLFAMPRRYVNIPAGSNGPLYSRHNHQPALTPCPNGDLLAIWYTCNREPGRELAVVASRLRRGQHEWEAPEIFWDAPDRNDHGNDLWWDGAETIFHFNGLSSAASWGNLALVMRTSTDNGASWTPARIIGAEHGLRHQVIASTTSTREGHILLTCDASSRGDGGTALHISPDGGKSWYDPGGTFGGIHGGVVQRLDGSLLGFGRGDTIAGKMPKSVSQDLGKTWTRTASEFRPIGGGQRLVLRRLLEGPLLLISFGPSKSITGADGKTRRIGQMYAAVSFDDGETWPILKLVSTKEPLKLDEGEWTRGVTLGPTSTEPRGYLTAKQSPDGVIHLISSALHYRFNFAWLTEARNR